MINNGISLILSSSSPHENVNFKVKFMQNGQELGDKYAISAKKINPFIYQQSKEHAKLSEKYFWTPLKLKSSDGDETWVKILKSDLKQHFEIEDDELTKVRDGIELENLIKAHLNKLLKEEGSELPKSENIEKTNSFYQSVVKFFLCHFVVYPSVKKVVREALENKAPLELADIYVKNREALLVHVKVHLADKNESALQFFGSEMISQVIDEALIAEINEKLVKQKEPIWNENKIQKLNELRVVDFLKRNPDEMINEEQLKKINLLKIPLSALATIPVTDKNLTILTNLWKQITEDLYAKGKLGALKASPDQIEIITQSYFADKYLEAYHSMPEEVKAHLTFEKKQVDEITNFALQHSAIGHSALQNEQQLYSEKIKPLIQKMIENYTTSSDVSNLLKVYTRLDEGSIVIESLVKDINKHLSMQEGLLFDGKLEQLIAQEIEMVAVVDYGLTSSQLNNLIEYREAYHKILKDHNGLTKAILASKEPRELFSLLRFEDEKMMPSRFLIEEKTSPFVDLDRELTIKRFYAVANSLSRMPESKFSNDKNDQVNEYVARLGDELAATSSYLKGIKERNSSHMNDNVKFNKGNAYIEGMLISKNVVQDLLNEENSSDLLDKDQQIGLMNLNRMLSENKLHFSNPNNPSLVSEQEKERIGAFLESIQNDAKFLKVLQSFKEKESNQFLEDALEMVPEALHGIVKKIFHSDSTLTVTNKIPAGISKDTIAFTVEYILRIKKMEKRETSLLAAQEKAENVLRKFENKEIISKKERLTLKDLGLLSSATRLTMERGIAEMPFSDELEGLGLIKTNASIQQLNETAKKSLQILEQIDQAIRPSIDSHYNEGDMFAYSAAKKEKWLDKPLDWKQKMVAFFSDNFTHGGKLYRAENGKIQTFHVYDNFVNEDFPFYEMCVSDVWSLNLAPLVPEFLEGRMKAIYGEEWGEKINGMYRKIENDLGKKVIESEKFKKMRNSPEKQFFSGAANYATLLNTFFGTEIKGHLREEERDFSTLHAKFFDNKDLEENQICSEFASKVTLVSMIELNLQLSTLFLKRYGEKFNNSRMVDIIMGDGAEVSEDVQAYANGVRHFGKDSKITKEAEKDWRKLLAKRGYKDSDIELAIRVGNKEILDLPYSKKERMRAIHPGRMVSLLVDKKCAVKRQLPPVIQTLLDID